MFVLLYINPKDIRIKNKGILVFTSILLVIILLNDISSFFRPYERYASFLLNILVFAPLFINKRLIKFRYDLFFTLCKLFTLYTLVSFGGLLIGIYPLVGFGGFQGVTVHAMSLSVIASISLLYSLMQYLKSHKIIFILFMSVSFIVIVIGASRAALLGAIIGSSVLLFKYKKFEFASLKPLIGILILLVGLLFILPEEYLGRITHKFDATKESGSALSSREMLWEARYNEFKESPIYGIGFGNMLEEYNEYGINEATGGIETGSSWGMILSMSGILGIMTFIVLIIKRFKCILKNTHSIQNSLIFGVFTFFLIHMIFEGYIFASGSIFMIFFWLTFSMTHYNLNKT